jgi:hypothetical protein
VVVKLYVDENADVSELIAEMDYDFEHPAIGDTEIVMYREV